MFQVDEITTIRQHQMMIKAQMQTSEEKLHTTHEYYGTCSEYPHATWTMQSMPIVQSTEPASLLLYLNRRATKKQEESTQSGYLGMEREGREL